MTRKAWVDQLLTKRDAVERAIGMPLGNMLGCGHWGCVFQSTSPWVVKFSIDPTEGPIWSKIAGLVRTEQWGTQGFTEIKSIHEIVPPILYGGKKRKVWAIVREGIEPVYKESRAHALARTDFTTSILERTLYNETDFERGMEGLRKYKAATTAWHVLSTSPRSASQRHIREIYRMDYGTREQLEEKIQRILDLYFGGGLTGPLGESLNMLASHGIYLRDVHMLNIGWHVARDDNDDWDRIVIFDPGHTPTKATEGIERALVENEREPLREFMLRLRREREGFRASVQQEIERTGAYVAMVNEPRADYPGGWMTITRSTRPGVNWQVTYWQGDPNGPDAVPTGHVDILGGLEDAAKEIPLRGPSREPL